MKTCAFIPNFFKIYNILWQAALPFLKKNKRLAPSFQRRATTGHLKEADIWIQAASAGEAFLALSLLTTLKPKQKTKILITSTTSQGMEILEPGLKNEKINPNIDCDFDWFPFDLPQAIQEAVTRVNPRVMVLLETEIWPGLLHYLKENHTKIFIVNARLSKKSARHYKLTRFLWKRVSPDNIFAISPLDAKRYGKVFDQARITTMPNIKFDLMGGIDDHSKLTALEKIIPKEIPLSILASIRRQEETQVLAILKQLLTKYPCQTVAIFPRHMHRINAWKKKLNQEGLSFNLRSQTAPVTKPITTPGIILWDTFGELRSAYGIASTVFVGGSLLPLGGQNFIEPAILGTPTITGPFLDDFTWVGEDIFKKGIVTKCKDHKEVAKTMVIHLETPVDKSGLKQKARDYIQKKQGGSKMASQMIIEALEQQHTGMTTVSK